MSERAKEFIRSGKSVEEVEHLEAENGRLNAQVAEWSRQNMAIITLEVEQRKRAEAAEGELAAARAMAAIGDLVTRNARAEGWQDDGEGAYEFIARRAYETGAEDAEAQVRPRAEGAEAALRRAYRELGALEIAEARETLRQAVDRTAPTPEEGFSEDNQGLARLEK